MDSTSNNPVLRTKAEKGAISNSGCRLNVLARISPPRIESIQRRQPVAIALVIDRSGSMAGPKLKAAKNAAQQLVRMLAPSDRVSVVSFDQEVRIDVPLTTPNESVINRIDAIIHGGLTALFDGWQKGMNQLLNSDELSDFHKRVVLLTDGMANRGLTHHSDVVPVVEKACKKGITTSCIGLGEDYEERLITAMAEAGTGNLVHLTEPKQLEAVFLAEVEGMSLTVGRDLRIRVLPSNGVKVRCIHNPIKAQEDGSFLLGNLQAGAEPVLAIELEVAKTSKTSPQEKDLLRVSAAWRNQEGEDQHLEDVLKLPIVEDAKWQELSLDPDVKNEVLLQRSARQRQDAMYDLDIGDPQATFASIQKSLCFLQNAEPTPVIENEKKLLNELLELLSKKKFSLSRKVMSAQSFMRARSRKIRDLDGNEDV